jgi:hypothetical protein
MSKSSHSTNLPLSTIHPDPEGAGLLNAPEMKIYDRIIMWVMQDRASEVAAALRELEGVPVEQRYVSRVIGALAFAFGDFDSTCIKFDLLTLPSKDRDSMDEILEVRAAQFCLLAREFFGVERMKTILLRVIDHAASSAVDASSPSDDAA